MASKKEDIAWSHPKRKGGGLSLSVSVERGENDITVDVGTGVGTSGPTLYARITEDNMVQYLLTFHDQENEEIVTELFGDIFEPSPGEGAEGQ